MKRAIITSLAALALSTAQAGFLMKIPLEQDQGGALPDGSINITPRTPGLPVENWQPAEPLYGEWVNVNDIYGCSNWTPATSTQPIGVIFQQTADDCKQDQTRNRQELEQETTTLVIRKKGTAVTETQTITASSTRTETGTGSECRYELGVYQWTTEGNVNTHTWPPFTINAGANTYINVGEYNYYRGPHISDNLYQICRDKI